jgi:phosphoenolpyruvate carboxykinase (GTP)
MTRCPSYSPQAEAPTGVPISAIVFGGRRQKLVPLVMQSKSWAHGVLLGASMASETTAAATGQVGVVRRDPMAMKPFCGYNFGDYWGHWLSFPERASKLPEIFHVNWFRKDDDGRFLWPGFGENMRVLEWIIRRCKGQAEAVDTPIGALPRPGDIDTEDLDIADGALDELLAVDRAAWLEETARIHVDLEAYGEHLPRTLVSELAGVARALQS